METNRFGVTSAKFTSGIIDDERDINGLPVNRKIGTGYRSKRDMLSDCRSDFTYAHEVSDAIDQESVINVLSEE